MKQERYYKSVLGAAALGMGVLFLGVTKINYVNDQNFSVIPVTVALEERVVDINEKEEPIVEEKKIKEVSEEISEKPETKGIPESKKEETKEIEPVVEETRGPEVPEELIEETKELTAIEVEPIEIVVEEPKKEEPVIEAIPEPVIQEVNYNFDVLQPSNLTEDDLMKALDGTKKGLQDVVHAVVDAEKEYGVNAAYLLATFALESGWGKYESAPNNIAGWTSTKGGFRSFDSRYDCVMTVAKGIATYYKESVGSKLKNVTAMYCPEDDYYAKVKQIINMVQRDATN